MKSALVCSEEIGLNSSISTCFTINSVDKVSCAKKYLLVYGELCLVFTDFFRYRWPAYKGER